MDSDQSDGTPGAAAEEAAATATATSTADAARTPTVKRHPIRGALWGLTMGVGLAAALIGFAVIAAGTLTPYVVALGGVVIGVLWGMLAPAKSPKGPAPT